MKQNDKTQNPKVVYPMAVANIPPQELSYLNNPSQDLSYLNSPIPSVDLPDETAKELSEVDELEYSSYTIASDGSQFSEDVDLWLQSFNLDPAASEPGNRWRKNLNQINLIRETYTDPRVTCPDTMRSGNGPLSTASLWYLLMTILPVFTTPTPLQFIQWTPSVLLAIKGMFWSGITRVCNEAHLQIQRIAETELARDIFTIVMDIILMLYTIGYLVLCLYQVCVVTCLALLSLKCQADLLLSYLKIPFFLLSIPWNRTYSA